MDMGDKLPGKRPYTALGTDSNTQSNAFSNTPPKRSRVQQPPPLSVLPGHVSFRFLCHESRVSAIIGKAGAGIKQLSSQTSSRIQIQDSLPGSDDRVIFIVAGTSPSKKLAIQNCPPSGAVNPAEEYVVSPAQEALIRVFDKVLDVAAAADGVAATDLGGGTVSCRMLAEAGEAGSVIGKKGKVIERIRKETGCKIRVLLGDKLPTGVKEGDEVIEIEGDIFSIKKALIAVSSTIQQYILTSDDLKTVNSRPLDPSPGARMHEPQLDVSTHSMFSSMVYTNPINHPLGVRPRAYEVDRCYPNLKPAEEQVVMFKLLCSNDTVGGVIGRGGSIVKAIEEETGVTVSIGPAIADCDDRLITVTSKESSESRFSSAQRAVVLIFSRSIVGRGSSNVSPVTARLLVPEHQIGCLLGKGGAVISEMRKATHTHITIMRGKQVSNCASEKDEVVQISGEFVNVQDALHQVTGRLQDNLFPHDVDPIAEPMSTYSSNIQEITDRWKPSSSIYEMNNSDISVRGTSASSILEKNYVPDIAGNRRSFLLANERNGLGSDGIRTSSTSAYEMYPSDVYTNKISSSLYETGLHERLSDPSSRELYQPTFNSLLSRHSGFNGIKHSPGFPHELWSSPSSDLWTSQVGVPGFTRRGALDIDRGLTSIGRSSAYGSTARGAIVTSTTLEILVPNDVIGSLYGANGSNLTRLKEISGAKIIVHEPVPGARDRTVVITGTPDQTHAAQSLLNGFIMTGRGI